MRVGLWETDWSLHRLTGFETLSQLLTLSEPQSPHLETGAATYPPDQVSRGDGSKGLAWPGAGPM